MMPRIAVWLLSMFLAMSGAAHAQPVRILALGSSLTQGYGLPPGTEFTVQLQAALKKKGARVLLAQVAMRISR